jgi:hypothetical protein
MIGKGTSSTRAANLPKSSPASAAEVWLSTQEYGLSADSAEAGFVQLRYGLSRTRVLPDPYSPDAKYAMPSDI